MLCVVLSTREVPHEVAEVHGTHLVLEEELHVLCKRDRRIWVFNAHDVDVVLLVLWVVVPDSREEAHVFRVVIWLAGLLVVGHQVFGINFQIAAIF